MQEKRQYHMMVCEPRIIANMPRKEAPGSATLHSQ